MSSLVGLIPSHNTSCCKELFFVVKLLATCLVQGGQPPVCFLPAVVDFLIYDETKTLLDDTLICIVWESLKKVCTQNV